MSLSPESKIQNPATAIAAVKLLLGSASSPRLAMQGSSMLPLMREPMVLELAPVAERIAVGDVVVFESDGKLVAHRVTSLRDGKLQTCGDARPWSPEHPAPHVLVGKVKAVFENDRSAVRVDTKIFRMRGAFYARTRVLRALPFRARASGRRIGRALPWRRERSYLALVDSMAAVVQGDRVGFERSLSRVEPSALVAVARRHGCSATLVEALRTFQTTGEAADYLRRVLQPLVRQGVMLTIALRGQIESIAATLARHNVPFALLKGAARSYRDEPGFVLHASSDIDILVPAPQLENAVAALRGQGYDERNYALLRERYKARHHHAAPLFPPSPGFAVELHTSLAPPGLLSTPLDWDTLRSHAEWVQGPAGNVLCLDATGAALHLGVHSIGLRRLRDSVLLARLLAKLGESERQELQQIAAAERIDPIRFSGSLAFGARIAGIAWPQTPEGRRYLDWTARREDVPLYFSQRCQLTEGWYAAGRRLGPLAWRLLDPRYGLDEQPQARSFGRIVGRALAGLFALAYTGAMGKTSGDEKSPRQQGVART